MRKPSTHRPLRGIFHAILASAAAMALVVLGGHPLSAVELIITGDPLEIRSDEFLRMRAFRNQSGTFVRQYYSTYNTYLRLAIGPVVDRSVYISSSNGTAPYTFTPVSHTSPDASTIQTTVTTADLVTIAHTVTYSTGAEIYRHEWVVTNGGTTTYSDVALRYGGDTFFGGSDNASGYYDANLGMVFCQNPNFSGLMGMFGGPESPADGYFETYYGTVVTALGAAANLPNTVDVAFVDNGMGLEWRRATLAPRDVFTIIAYEKWTESGAVQVIAPAPLAVDAGQVLNVTFTVTNLQTTADTVELAVVAPNGWVATVVGSVQVAAQTSIPVDVAVAIPTDATGVNPLTLTLTKRNPQTGGVLFTHSDYVNLTINGTVTPGVDLPASSIPLSVGDQTVYAAISPATLSGVSNVLSALAGVSTTTTRAFAWDGDVGSYVELPYDVLSLPGGVVPETGIFIATRQALTFNLDGEPEDAIYSPYTMTIRFGAVPVAGGNPTGWTFAGIPPVEVDVNDVRTSFIWPQANRVTPVPPAAALEILVNNQLLSDGELILLMGNPTSDDLDTTRPWWWNNVTGQYEQVSTLVSGQAYWFKNNSTQDITIQVSGVFVAQQQQNLLATDSKPASLVAGTKLSGIYDRGQPPSQPGANQGTGGSSSSTGGSAGGSSGGCGSGSGLGLLSVMLLMGMVSLRFLVVRR